MILSYFSPQPLSFGEQKLTDRMWQEQLVIALAVIVPFFVVVGQVSLRLSSRCPLFFVRADIWNSLVRLVMADLIIELMQQSLTCVPFEQEDDVKELLFQSLGMGCPLYARTLDAEATLKIFCLRIFCVSLGLFFGEGWMPVAITGGIATGKSTVSLQLVAGVEESETPEGEDKLDPATNRTSMIEGGTIYRVDTDVIGHDILLQGTSGNVYSKVVAIFSKDILSDDEPAVDDLDPPIDRTKLGALIFEDSSLRKKLNRITHPKIISKLVQKLSWGLFASGLDLSVADVPLLFEASVFLRMLFCITICVTCTPEEEQLKRLQSRNPQLTKEECQQRIASQMPLSKKVQMADIVIDNSGDAAALSKRVEEVREELMMRLYGVGLTLFQIVAIMGLSLPVAIYYKLYYANGSSAADDGGLPDAEVSGEY